MRALITGITGFVGSYLKTELIKQGIEVFGTTRNGEEEKTVCKLDIQDKDGIITLLKRVKPTHVFHLAGISNVRDSWLRIPETLHINTIGTANLLEGIYKTDSSIRVLTIGSSEEYGCKVKENNKITEDSPLHPLNPYGISKAAVSRLTEQYHKAFGLDVIHLRPFNHIGPGQKLGFVTSDFAYQIAQINKGKANDNVINIGNLDSIRDIADVRDIVKAYFMISLKGNAGETYNVCTSSGTKIQDILNLLLSFSKKDIEIKLDPSRIRPSDTPYLVGANTKLVKQSGWEPAISLTESLSEIYEYWIRILP